MYIHTYIYYTVDYTYTNFSASRNRNCHLVTSPTSPSCEDSGESAPTTGQLQIKASSDCLGAVEV